MHTVKLKVDDRVYNNVMFLLENLKIDGLEIAEIDNKKVDKLSKKVEKSLNSKLIDKSHDEIFDELISKYAKH